MNCSRSLVSVVLAGCAVISISASAEAASFPEHPIHIYVGFAPGGSMDFSARLVAQKLSEKWGQPVIVENRAGADSTIAGDVVAHSPPDGYSIEWIGNPHIVSPILHKVNYDPVKSFAPITEVVSTPDVLVTNASVPANNAKEFIQLAKAQPNKLNFASAGAGTLQYLEFRLFESQAGIQMTGVEYKGGAPALVGLLSNEVQATFGSLVGSVPQIKAGKFKALGLSTAARSQLMPELPGLAEAAGIDFDVSEWFGAVAPAGTPKDVVTKIHDDIAEVVKIPEVEKALTDHGFAIVVDSPDHYRKALLDETAKWEKVAKDIGVK